MPPTLEATHRGSMMDSSAAIVGWVPMLDDKTDILTVKSVIAVPEEGTTVFSLDNHLKPLKAQFP